MAVRHTIFNAVVCGYTAIIVKKEDLAICLQRNQLLYMSFIIKSVQNYYNSHASTF